MKFVYPAGATPLDQDEVIGLIPSHITIQSDLNEWEANNILEAESWVYSASHHGNILTLEFIKILHKKMFNKTWKWAGSFRKTEKNIGVSPFKITSALSTLLDDVRCKIENQSFQWDELAYRFHHRLVKIHPFPNGNGRHARLMTDLLLVQAGQLRFTWGSKKLDTEGEVRRQYIEAMRAADKGDYSFLSIFVRA